MGTKGIVSKSVSILSAKAILSIEWYILPSGIYDALGSFFRHDAGYGRKLISLVKIDDLYSLSGAS